MPSDLLAPLKTRKEELLVQKRALEEEVFILDALIIQYESGSIKVDDLIKTLKSGSQKGVLKMVPPLSRKQRVRGVLAVAKKAIELLPSPFDKNDVLAKVQEIDQEFAHKKITGSNIRNALRSLAQTGVIKKTSEATATSCAKYIRAA